MIKFIMGDAAKVARTLCLIVPFIVFLPTYLMPYMSVNLKNVHVYPSQVGSQVYVVARRDTYNSWASYTTTITNTVTSISVCDSPRQQRARRYQKNAASFIVVSLAWWVGSEEDLNNCRRLGLKENTPYIMKTCHYWHGLFDVILARRCVDSNIFTLNSNNAAITGQNM